MVSVIVPAYNMAAYLAETLDSILASTYTNIEVIVMDDGSTDNSYDIAKSYAIKDKRIKAYTKKNGGVSTARNAAISLAKGQYILPVDADNTIEPTFIEKAVETISSDPDIKVVAPTSDFFGDKTGIWKLPPFSLDLLARKNIMDNCALYRKEDWERVGGYCPQIVTREDWAFWISILKDGGKVVILPEVYHHYRIRSTSKRVTNRNKKFQVIDKLNNLHPEFFERILHGPLQHRRSLSKLMNLTYRFLHPRRVHINPEFARFNDQVKAISAYFQFDCGTVVHDHRNQIRQLNWLGETVIAKFFASPNIVNRLAYGLFRKSKARRSFEYAELLRKSGIGSPEPIAYYEERCLLFFGKSFYVCLKSECDHSYADLMNGDYPNDEEPLRAIAQTAANMHNLGMIHKDFSRGNILFRYTDNGVKTEIIDLNRIRFHKVDIHEGCRNFSRLPGTERMMAIFADEYAKQRGFDKDECLKLILKYKIE